MAYATTGDIAAGYRTLTADETAKAERLIEEASVIIDTIAPKADAEAKQVVTCNMVRRALAAGDDIPIGATQGTVTAGGYSQSWSAASGTGELYLSRLDKRLLRAGNRIGTASPYDSEVSTA